MKVRCYRLPHSITQAQLEVAENESENHTSGARLTSYTVIDDRVIRSSRPL
jgi:hypothetical protein